MADHIDGQGALTHGGAWNGRLDLPEYVTQAAERTLVKLVPDAQEREEIRAMLGLTDLPMAAMAGSDSSAVGAGSN